jgi:hypothetical protein
MSHPLGIARRSFQVGAASFAAASLATGSVLLLGGPAFAGQDKAPPGQAEAGRSNAQARGHSGTAAGRSHAAPGQAQASGKAGSVPAERGSKPAKPAKPAKPSESSEPAARQRASAQGQSHGPASGSSGGSASQRGPGTTSRPPKDSGGKSDAADRPGNNGTVKIDTAPYDSHPNNEPHVVCAFEVDFYNYGAGDYNAKVEFALHPPTADDRSMTVASGDPDPFIGGDRPGGGTDVDAQETYELAFSGDPHPKQGYHVKLTINAPFSQGADTKHKVFWVQPCASEEQPPGGETPGGETPGGETPGGETPGGEVPGGGVPGGEVPGGGVPSGGVPGGGVPGGEVPGGEVPGGQTPGQPGAVTPPASTTPGAASRPASGSAAREETVSAATELGVFGAARSSAPTSAGRVGAAAAPGPRAGAPAAVPTAVEAGLAGDSPTDLGMALATSLLGVCGLLAAGVAVTAYRRRGAHQVW